MSFLKHSALHHGFLFVLSLAILFGLVAVTSRLVLANNFILANVKVADIAVGGMTYMEAADALNNTVANFLSQTVSIRFENQVKQIFLSDLGVEFDTYRTVESLHHLSFGPSFARHLQTRLLSFVEPTEVPLLFSVDRDVFEKELRQLFPEIGDPEDAQIVVKSDGKVEVRSHQDSYAVDFEPVYTAFAASVSALEVPSLVFEGELLRASYTEEAAMADVEILELLLQKEYTYIYSGNGLDYKKVMKIQPDWLFVKDTKVSFDTDAMNKFFVQNVAPEIDIAEENAVLKALPGDGVRWANVSGTIRDGRKLQIEQSVANLVKVIEEGGTEVSLEVSLERGKIVNETGADFLDLELLGEGKSNFKGSPEGRDFNIRKGLGEKFHNVILKPGEEFSFNSYLGAVTYSNGWKGALAIFGGGSLSMVPGGGLCQVATTVYRAILNSGFWPSERHNHSLYVHYYTEYGDGLDATIYPGQKDLRFTNDTGGYLVIQAYAEGDDGYVRFYGVPDGRTTELSGPFYSGKVPDELKDRVKVAWNQIKWLHKVVRRDGAAEEHEIVSTYRTAPR